jgi:hypothetical protein
VAIIRAATTVELALNLAIRAELVRKRRLPANFVDKLLRWASGITGKVDKIISPLAHDVRKLRVIKKLKQDIQLVNRERNKVAHSGEFKSKKTARKVIQAANGIILGLVRPYIRGFSLDELNDWE